MVISSKQKYIFVGLPFSASSAISRELIEYYDGESILAKHTNIPYLIQKTNINIKTYFVFGVYRDPIELVFTQYNKLKYNAKGVYTDPKFFRENGGHVSAKARKLYFKIQEENWSFEDYIRNVYRVIPFDSVYSLNAPYLDLEINFSNLQEDFKSALIKCGIEPKRELPMYNKTEKKDSGMELLSDKTKMKAFGPFINQHSPDNKLGAGKLIPQLIYYFVKPIRKYHWLRRDKYKSHHNDEYFKKFVK